MEFIGIFVLVFAVYLLGDSRGENRMIGRLLEEMDKTLAANGEREKLEQRVSSLEAALARLEQQHNTYMWPFSPTDDSYRSTCEQKVTTNE